MEILMVGLIVFLLAAFLGLGLGIAAKYLHVEEDATFTELMALLPQYNCGACGQPGCAGFTTALLDGADPKDCKPCKEDQREVIRDFLKNLRENK